jgi:hypothetical protein
MGKLYFRELHAPIHDYWPALRACAHAKVLGMLVGAIRLY